VHRRLLDRLFGALILLSLRRYRCGECGWQGNLMLPPHSGRPDPGSDARYTGHGHRI
jgi:hypothetical protein